MKKLKFIAIAMVVAVCLFMFTACDFDFSSALQDIIENNVFPYSEDGTDEIAINFAAINSESDVSFLYQWNIIIDAETDDDFLVKYYKDTKGEQILEKYVYQKGETIKTLLQVGESSYYIDENTNIVYSENTLAFNDLNNAIDNAMEYGVINLVDDGLQSCWDLVLKSEDATATNFDDEQEQFVKYDYTSVEETASINSTEMSVYFKQQLIPTIERIDYVEKENDAIISSIIVYMLWDITDVSEDDFTVPSTEDGYTFYNQ